ncbi:MAG TPA: hypothetical protein DCM61_03560, partial [Clostridiales bacterium]|nr:hypothetical protein [Clostridiales bacterium]
MQKESNSLLTAKSQSCFFPSREAVEKARVQCADITKRILAERQNDPTKIVFIEERTTPVRLEAKMAPAFARDFLRKLVAKFSADRCVQ